MQKLLPDAILVLSKRLWDWLSTEHAFPEESDDWWHYKIPGGVEAIATFIHHPSSRGFRGDDWSDRVEQLLRRGQAKASVNGPLRKDGDLA